MNHATTNHAMTTSTTTTATTDGTVSKIVCEAVIRQAGAVAPAGKDHC
jgi:hypothetical protein